MERGFETFGALAAHLENVAGSLHKNEHEACELIGRRVEEHAKAKIGTEQAGWPELAESTIDDKSRQGYAVPAPLLRTGEMRDTIEHTVDEHSAVIGSDSQIAVWQEMGTSRMPARSFLGSSMVDTKDENLKTVEDVAVIKSFRV